MRREAPRSEPLRLLVVDDDVVVPMLLALGLDQVEIVEATRRRSAHELAIAEPPDALIVDQNLPDGEGLALIRTLREHPATADLPMVLISAGHEESLRGNVLRAGADDYVAKPIEPARLEALVRELLAAAPEALRERRQEARGQPLRASDPTGPLEPPPASAAGTVDLT